jgi:hypothetical protein
MSSARSARGQVGVIHAHYLCRRFDGLDQQGGEHLGHRILVHGIEIAVEDDPPDIVLGYDGPLRVLVAKRRLTRPRWTDEHDQLSHLSHPENQYRVTPARRQLFLS